MDTDCADHIGCRPLARSALRDDAQTDSRRIEPSECLVREARTSPRSSRAIARAAAKRSRRRRKDLDCFVASRLAMTRGSRLCTTTSTVIARLDRAIQYSGTGAITSKRRGVLDTPPSRGMTTECLAASPATSSRFSSCANARGYDYARGCGNGCANVNARDHATARSASSRRGRGARRARR